MMLFLGDIKEFSETGDCFFFNCYHFKLKVLGIPKALPS